MNLYYVHRGPVQKPHCPLCLAEAAVVKHQHRIMSKSSMVAIVTGRSGADAQNLPYCFTCRMILKEIYKTEITTA